MLVIILGLLLTILDQMTKQMVRWSFNVGESDVVIAGFFNLTYVRNTGAAWGILSGQNIGLILLSVIMLLFIIFFRRSFMSDTLVHRIALGMMIGGILGNLLDRLRFGWVTDFLDFYIKDYHWPVFNVADICICVGVGLYIVSSFVQSKRAA